LLLEPQRTNLALYSEQIDDAAWIKNSATVTANAAISPDGTQNADRVNFSGGGPIEQLIFYAADNLTHTISAYVKVQSGTASFRFKITHAGVVNYFSPYYTATTTWQRFSFSQAFGSGGIGFYAGVDGSGNTLDIYGVQLEPNSSYATSYIPTTSAGVTRVADAASKTGISSLIGQTEGTLFFDLPAQTLNVSNYQTFFLIYNNAGLAAKYFHLYKNVTSTDLKFEVFDSTLQCTLTFTMAQNTRYKVAAVYKNNRFELWVNGTLASSDTSGTVATNVYDKMELGHDSFNANSQITCGQALLFKTALTTAQLAELTTL
jgi:hypothetical protein